MPLKNSVDTEPLAAAYYFASLVPDLFPPHSTPCNPVQLLLLLFVPREVDSPLRRKIWGRILRSGLGRENKNNRPSLVGHKRGEIVVSMESDKIHPTLFCDSHIDSPMKRKGRNTGRTILLPRPDFLAFQFFAIPPPRFNINVTMTDQTGRESTGSRKVCRRNRSRRSTERVGGGGCNTNGTR